MKKHPPALAAGLSLLYCVASGSASAAPHKGYPDVPAQQNAEGTVWSKKLNWKQRFALGGYHNIKSLFQAMRYDPDNIPMRETSAKLTDALTDLSSGKARVNEAFAKKMDHVLDGKSGKALQDRIARLVDENPRGLNAAMDGILSDIDHAPALVYAIPLPAAPKTRPAPARTGT